MRFTQETEMRALLTTIAISLSVLITYSDPVMAVVFFNDGDAMILNDTFTADKIVEQGGIILYLRGVIDGATIDLQTQPFRTGQGIEWIPLEDCSITALPATCRVAIGQGEIRLAIAGGGGSLSVQAIGYEASAIVGDIAGGSVSGLLEGPVLFGDAAGQIAQDAVNLHWDDTNDRLGIGTANPLTRLTVVGQVTVNPLGLLDEEPMVNSSAGTLGAGIDINAFRATGNFLGQLRFLIQNTLGEAVFQARTLGSGDTFLLLDAIAQDWSIGMDQSDSNNFHITSFADLTAQRHFTIDTSGNVSIGGAANSQVSLRASSGEIANSSVTGFLITDGLLFGKPVDTTPPAVCNASREGNEYYDSNQSTPCFCDGTDWVQTTDSAMNCT